MNVRDYRVHLYQNRAHPIKEGVVNQKADATSLYLSIGAFVAVEYFLQLKFNRYSSGLLFPMGFLFFWAFYYTYYQPGDLEKRLTSERKWDLSGIPVTLMTSCIWFVKIVFVELTEKIITSLISSKKQRAREPQYRTKPKVYSAPSESSKSQPLNKDQTPHGRQDETITLLPRELINALGVMGIPNERDWNMIQKRYRELAKKYHPDLNPELTQAGNRFMLYDVAYRKLESSKTKYFPPKNITKAQ